MTTDDAKEFTKYLWLSAIADDLSPAAREIHRGLQERFGDKEHIDRLSWVSSVQWMGERSPVSAETLREWSVRDIVRYAAAYQGPEESFDSTSKDGLAKALTQEVKRRPIEFATHALEFTALGHTDSARENPRYIAGLMHGLAQWVRESKTTDQDEGALTDALTAILSSPVTQLIEWISSRPDSARALFVPTWSSSLNDAADLLLYSLESLSKLPPSAISLVLETNLRGLLRSFELLLTSSDPGSDRDHDDPIFVCINSTRGHALHGLITLQTCWDRSDQPKPPSDQSLGKLHPDVARLMEERLQNERSPAIRCVFGWRFPYLYSLALDGSRYN